MEYDHSKLAGLHLHLHHTAAARGYISPPERPLRIKIITPFLRLFTPITPQPPPERNTKKPRKSTFP